MEHLALVVSVNQIVDRVFVVESTGAAIDKAILWMSEDGVGEGDVRRCLGDDGYFEYGDEDITTFEIAPACVEGGKS